MGNDPKTDVNRLDELFQRLKIGRVVRLVLAQRTTLSMDVHQALPKSNFNPRVAISEEVMPPLCMRMPFSDHESCLFSPFT